MLSSLNLFDQPVKNDIRTYQKTGNTTNGNGDDFKFVCFIDYTYFKED